MTAVPRAQAVAVIVIAIAATVFLLFDLTAQSPVQSCSPNCGPPPVPPFAVGNPIAGTCPAGGSFATRGCTFGDFVYNLTIESSSITFGEVLFHIETPNGTLYVASGPYSGFAILHSTGSLVAHYQTVGGVMNMTSGWMYVPGTTASTPLSTIYSIVVDVGTADPHNQGYEFVAYGTGSFSGTAFVGLP
jgi:hypothetical protein